MRSGLGGARLESASDAVTVDRAPDPNDDTDLQRVGRVLRELSQQEREQLVGRHRHRLQQNRSDFMVYRANQAKRDKLFNTF